MAGVSEKLLFREILGQTLLKMQAGEIHTSHKLDVKKELQRLSASIQVSKEAELGANAILTGRLKEVSSNNTIMHSEETAQICLRDIIRKTKSQFIVIVDDLERLKYYFDGEETYFKFIMSLSKNIDEGFSNSGVSFIISLDEAFSNRVKNYDNPTVLQDNSLSYGALLEIKTFPPETLLEVISRRIKITMGKPVLNFIEEEAFWTLQMISSGHARRALSVLRAAMEYNENNNRALIIDKEAIIQGSIIRGIEFDEVLLKILEFIFQKGVCAPSEKVFQEVIGIPFRTLIRKVKDLSDRLDLTIEHVPPNQKQLFKLKKLAF